jgi:hypothetical protein
VPVSSGLGEGFGKLPMHGCQARLTVLKVYNGIPPWKLFLARNIEQGVTPCAPQNAHRRRLMLAIFHKQIELTTTLITGEN